ncbi:hypothetical protein [Bacillus anthracis]|uniref:hypothetical protein n=1 Tax=Bacillus anthracis TaxID=1392 RepID=UPI0001DBF607|nr:hypothetical protein [Bacillus cereus]ADK08357.1 hypothetical protein BACI_pBAslCI1400030 [Bacillus cereus biovar anthracis str. CI]
MASLKQLEKRLKKIQEQRIPKIDVMITDDREYAESYRSKAKECIIIIDDISATFDENFDVMEEYREESPEHYAMLMRLKAEDEEIALDKTSDLDKWVKGDILYIRIGKRGTGGIEEIDLNQMSKGIRREITRGITEIH